MTRQTILIKCAPIALLSLALSLVATPCTAQSEADSEFPFSRYRPSLEPVVEMGLAFLAREQQEDGSFPGPNGSNPGLVGLAGMAFLAKGYLPDSGPYRFELQRCIDFILDTQVPNGGFGTGSRIMYDHSLSCLFLSEVSGMVDPERQGRLNVALPPALRLILDSQAVRKKGGHEGGWRYKVNSSDSDLSVTGWCLMALRSARQGDAPVPDESIAKVMAYIASLEDEDGGGFGYTSTSATPSMTAVGLLCMELTGYHGHPTAMRAANHLLTIVRDKPELAEDPYLNYYAAQAMFQLGGRYWNRYATDMYKIYLPRQNPDGSWLMERGKWAGKLGPVFDTSMTLLALTVPYRQLPIYQRDEAIK